MTEIKLCGFIPKGQAFPCGKRCYKNNFCSRHHFWINKRLRIPKPCKKCGKAVLVEYQLCSDCDGRKIYYKNKCIIEKTKENHKMLMIELKIVYFFQQKKLFI